MVRFFDLLVVKVHAGISYLRSRFLYERKRSELRADVICSLGHCIYFCRTVDDVVRRVGKIHGPFSGPAVMRTIRDLKRERFIAGAHGPLTGGTELQLNSTGVMKHTSIHILNELRARKERVAA